MTGQVNRKTGGNGRAGPDGTDVHVVRAIAPELEVGATARSKCREKQRIGAIVLDSRIRVG